jgi:hypothetical protein
MSVLNTFVPMVFACAWFSIFAIPIAAIPSGLLAYIFKARDRSNRALVGSHEARKIPFFVLGLIGGFAGECMAVCSLFFATEWSCFKGQQLCHDGQAGMELMFTIPFFAVLGSIVAILWTRLTLRFSPQKIYASILTYAGPSRTLNLSASMAFVFAMWLISTLLATALLP